MRIPVKSIERTSLGKLTVEFIILGYVYTIDDVTENIMRCALGDDDLEYLTTTVKMLTDDEFEQHLTDDIPIPVCSDDESQCFSVHPTEFKYCMKWGVIRTDSTGRPDAQFLPIPV